jgi:hypothetical protein
MYSFDIKFTPINADLMTRGINLPNGTGTIEKGLSMLLSQKINGTEYFTLYKGCKCDKIDVEITADGPINCSMTFLAISATTPSTTVPLTGTPTYATNPTNPPFTGLTAGSNPLVINSNNVDTPSFKFSVTNNLATVKPNGELNAKFVEPTNRDVTFSFDTWRKDVTLLTDTKALTARAMTYRLTGPGSSPANLTATFTNAYMEKWTTSYSPTANDVQSESFDGVAQAVAVS